MRCLGILILLNVGLCSTAFKLLNKAKNEHPRGFGTAKHAVIIGEFIIHLYISNTSLYKVYQKKGNPTLACYCT